MDTKRKVALVTGASRGIGKAISIELGRSGFDVALAARSVEEHSVNPWPGSIHITADLVRKRGARALPVQADLNKTEDVKRLVDSVMQEFGRIDVVVNNARYMGPAHWSMFLDTKWEDIESAIAINVRSMVYLHYLCIPIMQKQGGGVFINLTTAEAFMDMPALPGKGSTGMSYPVTKAAFNRVAPMLAREFKTENIAIINLSPGFVLTERSVQDVAGKSYDMSTTHSVWVPARAAAFLATCKQVMAFSGKYIEAKELVREHALMTDAELATPWHGPATKVTYD